MMGGWKTWVGAALIGVGAVLEYFGYSELAKLVLGLGGMFGIVGLGHKIEKAGNGKS